MTELDDDGVGRGSLIGATMDLDWTRLPSFSWIGQNKVSSLTV